MMKVLLVGVGGVGEAIAVVAKDGLAASRWSSRTMNRRSRRGGLGEIGEPPTVPRRADRRATRHQVADVARRDRADLIMNAVDPRFVMPIFDGSRRGCELHGHGDDAFRGHTRRPLSAAG